MHETDAVGLTEYVYGVDSLVKDGDMCSFETLDAHESEVSRCILATVSKENKVHKELVAEVKKQVPDDVVWDGS